MHHHLPARRSQSSSRMDMPTLFDQVFGMLDPSSLATSSWAPRVDIHETPESFLIQADLPGIDPKDIEVHMEHGVLTLKGERTHEHRDPTDQGVRLERQYGAFHRRFGLPDSADAEAIEASCRNGVLELTIPKKPETKARRIEVK